MFTEIEGEWDAVMEVVKRATFVLAEKGIRTEVVLKADIRPNFSNMMAGKLDRLNEAMEEKPQPVEEKPQPQPQPKPQSVEDRIRDTLHRIGGKR